MTKLIQTFLMKFKITILSNTTFNLYIYAKLLVVFKITILSNNRIFSFIAFKLLVVFKITILSNYQCTLDIDCYPFSGIQNNNTLKPSLSSSAYFESFSGIQNNNTLKPYG